MAIILPKKGGFGESIGAASGSGIQNLLQSLGTGIEMRQQANALEQMGVPRGFAGSDSHVLANLLRGAQAAQIQNRGDILKSFADEIARGREGIPQVAEKLTAQETPQGEEIVAKETVKEATPALKTPEYKLQRQIQNLEKRLESEQSPTLKSALSGRKEELENKLQKISKENATETKEVFQRIEKEGRAAKSNNIRLDKMEELIKKGNLTNPSFAAFLESLSKGIFGFGIDLFSLTNPDSERFRKLSKDFLSEVKDVFGGRLNEFEVKSFLERIPSLSQSNEGKAALINDLRAFNDAALLKQQAAREIIKENGGIRPQNLEQLVDEKIAPKLDELASRVKEDKSVPETQSLLGSLLRAPALSGAATGAAIGSSVPGVGTGVGAILGGLGGSLLSSLQR